MAQVGISCRDGAGWVSNMIFETDNDELDRLGHIAQYWVATIAGFYLIMGLGFLVAGVFTSAVDLRRTIFACSIFIWVGQVCAHPAFARRGVAVGCLSCLRCW